MKDQFLLDPEVVFLNHGSFGACPRPVMEAYQAWQRRLERQPVLFLGRQLNGLLAQARQPLADYLHTAAENLVYIPNATYGVNLIARSLDLQPGDEILTSDHEYGACAYAWEFVCSKTGARLVKVPLPLPALPPEEMADLLWAASTTRTRLIFLSHITSPTALRLPVEEICRRARQTGILTLVDGAHAPGQIPLNLDALGADFYTGNCHKWLLSPKGAAFLYTRPERQALVEPLVVSWGYHAAPETTAGSPYLDLLQWTGTHDPAAALAVPAALDFMQAHRWPAVQRECQALLARALAGVNALTSLPDLYSGCPPAGQQMGAAFLPAHAVVRQLKTALYDRFRIEIPLYGWNDKKLIRISIQAYNSQQNIEALLAALTELL
ncbi:MAG: aminotransferase class V-fold PLP-dependent enzyme [Chloroflexi bacterium]|nr:aminotransferase class V-fold PLP-dependent enzyme [Chloroflexota bacterium]